MNHGEWFCLFAFPFFPFFIFQSPLYHTAAIIFPQQLFPLPFSIRFCVPRCTNVSVLCHSVMILRETEHLSLSLSSSSLLVCNLFQLFGLFLIVFWEMVLLKIDSLFYSLTCWLSRFMKDTKSVASRLMLIGETDRAFNFWLNPSSMYRFDRWDEMGWDGKAGRTGVSRNSDIVGSIGIFIDEIGEKTIKIHMCPIRDSWCSLPSYYWFMKLHVISLT